MQIQDTAAHRKPGGQNSTPEKFWAKATHEPNDGCWLFTGAVTKDTGYGKVGYHGRIWGAHRLAWELTYGPIPDGLWVLHKCDVRLCVRPDHLFLGTVGDNNRDMHAKGRGHIPIAPIRRGEQATGAKLTVVDVAEIHRAYAAREASQEELAARFSVARTDISRIISGKRWSHMLPGGRQPKRAYVKKKNVAGA